MKSIKKILFMTTALVVMGSPLAAADSAYTYGNGYCEYRSCPHTCAAWVFGAAALAAIIAVAVQNSENEHSHAGCGN